MYCILQPPFDQPAVDGEGAAVGLWAEDKPFLSPCMPVLLALKRIVGDFQDTFFFRSRREKKSCSFTATLNRRSVCHLFQHDVDLGLTERDKCLLTSQPIQCSVF